MRLVSDSGLAFSMIPKADDAIKAATFDDSVGFGSRLFDDSEGADAIGRER